MGKKVTMFFTFWGLNAIRKPQRTGIRKKLLETMFEWMMPRGSRNLKLSNMNMLGIGTKLMRKIMADKNISSLEELIAGAQAQGVRILACQMSMDAMGLRREELLDGVETVGVGTFLGASEEGNMTLFI